MGVDSLPPDPPDEAPLAPGQCPPPLLLLVLQEPPEPEDAVPMVSAHFAQAGQSGDKSMGLPQPQTGVIPEGGP